MHAEQLHADRDVRPAVANGWISVRFDRPRLETGKREKEE